MKKELLFFLEKKKEKKEKKEKKGNKILIFVKFQHFANLKIHKIIYFVNFS